MADVSDYLPASLQFAATVLSAGSQIAKGESYEAIGARRKAASEFEAQQLEQEAATAQGIGMRKAATESLNLRVVNSLALARAAASGAGASDPTVLNVMAQTAGESAYRQSLAMYEGEAQARLDLMRASAQRYEGDTAVSDAASAKSSADMAAVSTALTGGVKAMSMYSKYWAGPGNKTPVSDTLDVPF